MREEGSGNDGNPEGASDASTNPTPPPTATKTLHHTAITATDRVPDEWFMVLHGIYGAGRNWASVARRLVGDRPRLGALALDLRGHGDSPAMEPPHTIEACAADVQTVVAAAGLGRPSVLGHSFGGKVALLYTGRAEGAPGAVWIIDSTPDVRSPGGSAWEMLGVLRRHPGPFSGRAEAISSIESAGFSRPVAQWMSTNVVAGSDGSWRWRLDPDQMEALLHSFFETDAWAVVEHPPAGTHIHFVKASESDILDADARARIQAAAMEHGRVHLHVVQGGHWLNADNPEGLHQVLVDNLHDPP